MQKVLIAWVFFFLYSGNALASIDVYEFENDLNRERYQHFLEELRCPKCKNNNLAGTNSKIAVDLRRQLHLMIEEGQSDQEIIDFMVLRYGDFVLYRPRVQPKTLALWAGPLVFLAVGMLVIGGIVWRRRRALNTKYNGLSEAESSALARLLKNQPASAEKNSPK